MFPYALCRKIFTLIVGVATARTESKDYLATLPIS